MAAQPAFHTAVSENSATAPHLKGRVLPAPSLMGADPPFLRTPLHLRVEKSLPRLEGYLHRWI